jgi:hypothetical protein
MFDANMFSDAESTAPGLAASTISAPDSSQSSRRMQDHALRLTTVEQISKRGLSKARLEQENDIYQSQLEKLKQQNTERLLIARPDQYRQVQDHDLPLSLALSHYDQIGADLSAQDSDAKTIFSLSDEFIYMFNKCRSSDVLQILRDNWHHYSQWISGIHMIWQDPEFVASSVQLKNQIGSYVVICASGTVHLRDTVLPSLDRQFDRERFIPAVKIEDPQDANWMFLGSFDVILIADVHYYLRCLLAISVQDREDIDSIAYIYDKIQSFYRGNEPIIQYVHSSVQGSENTNQRSARHSSRGT